MNTLKIIMHIKTHMASRIRRVKCDETIPHCRRCTETGRKCEGPIVRQLRFIHNQAVNVSTTRTPSPEISLLAPQHKGDERRAFHYFTHHTAPFLAGTVDASFWLDLVPRLAQTYNFVWDTAVCIASLAEHVPYRALPATTDSTGLNKVITNYEHRQALRFYNRAIVNVRQLAESAQMDDSVIALSYILFASVEFQQRNVKTGTELMKRCCKILSDNLTSLSTRPHSTAGQAIHQVVAPFVLRKAVTTATLGNGPSPLSVADDEAVNETLKAVLSGSPTLDEARVQLQNLVFDCYEEIRLADFISNLRDGSPRQVLFMSRCQSLLDQMRQWKASFAATRNDRTADGATDWIASYLLVYWAVCYISLATCLTQRQTIFDDYMAHFADIVQHAAVYLRHDVQSSTNMVPFLSGFNPGVLPPLYFCATKCRDPNLRRQALRLMRQAPRRQEDLWAFIVPDRVVAKLISVEEAEEEDKSQLPSSKRSLQSQHATGLPPEERRFAHVCVVSRPAAGGKYRPALELGRYEFSTDGSRKLIHRYTWLDDEEEKII